MISQSVSPRRTMPAPRNWGSSSQPSYNNADFVRKQVAVAHRI
jgi:hypothetical protein